MHTSSLLISLSTEIIINTIKHSVCGIALSFSEFKSEIHKNLLAAMLLTAYQVMHVKLPIYQINHEKRSN